MNDTTNLVSDLLNILQSDTQEPKAEKAAKKTIQADRGAAQKEKKIPHIMLVNAETVRQAYDRVEERLGKIDDYEITDVNITPILEIFPYENENMRNLIPLASVTQLVE